MLGGPLERTEPSQQLVQLFGSEPAVQVWQDGSQTANVGVSGRVVPAPEVGVEVEFADVGVEVGVEVGAVGVGVGAVGVGMAAGMDGVVGAGLGAGTGAIAPPPLGAGAGMDVDAGSGMQSLGALPPFKIMLVGQEVQSVVLPPIQVAQVESQATHFPKAVPWR